MAVLGGQIMILMKPLQHMKQAEFIRMKHETHNKFVQLR